MSTPFDLHVLSTPPAFILSQDQTLNKMVSKQQLSLLLKSSYRANLLASKKINVVPQSFKLYGQLNVRFGASCFSYVV